MQPRATSSGMALPLGLAFLAGYVDAYGLLKLATFVSFMSGNTTQTGAAAGQAMIGQALFAAAVPSAIAIVCFVVGVFIGTWLHVGSRRALNPIVFGSITGLLALVFVLEQFAALNANLAIALLSIAMGLLNITVSQLGPEPISVTFVTGVLNKLGQHLAWAARGTKLENAADARDTHLRRAGWLALLWTCFLLGAVLLAVVIPHLNHRSLLLPTLVLGLISIIAAR